MIMTTHTHTSHLRLACKRTSEELELSLFEEVDELYEIKDINLWFKMERFLERSKGRLVMYSHLSRHMVGWLGPRVKGYHEEIFMSIFRMVWCSGGWSVGANSKVGFSRFGLSVLAERSGVLSDGHGSVLWFTRIVRTSVDLTVFLCVPVVSSITCRTVHEYKT
jgi:hypothetical protein